MNLCLDESATHSVRANHSHDDTTTTTYLQEAYHDKDNNLCRCPYFKASVFINVHALCRFPVAIIMINP